MIACLSTREMARRTLLLLGLLGLALPAQAVLEIDITQGVESAIPIAITPFAAEGAPAPPLGVAEIVDADLRRSGFFTVADSAQLPQQPKTVNDIDFAAWRAQGLDNLVIGSLQSAGPQQYTVQFQLFDTVQQGQLLGYQIPAPGGELRRAAHKISDLIFQRLTGIPGAFSTRVAYVSLRQEGATRRYFLQIADADGYNPQTVLSSLQPILSPAWSPDGAHLAYVSFENGRSEIYAQNLHTGSRQKLSSRKGINSAPVFSPDGRRLALTLSHGKNPDIYIMDIAGGAIRQLTDTSAIDTEPVWMPDGQTLIFTSDRSGRPQLYRIPVTGGAAERITFTGNYNAAPDVSPDGKRVAMVHNDGAGFRIAVQDLQTGTLQVLTDGTLDESPSFAPNSSMIIYATRDQGRGVLAAVSEDGRVKQRLRLQEGEVREPAWSPFPG